MANGEDATRPSEDGADSVVAVLKCPPKGASRSDWNEHVDQARIALSHGRTVAVTGVTESEPPYDWGLDTMCGLSSMQPDGPYMEWQCE